MSITQKLLTALGEVATQIYDQVSDLEDQAERQTGLYTRPVYLEDTTTLSVPTGDSEIVTIDTEPWHTHISWVVACTDEFDLELQVQEQGAAPIDYLEQAQEDVASAATVEITGGLKYDLVIENTAPGDIDGAAVTVARS